MPLRRLCVLLVALLTLPALARGDDAKKDAPKTDAASPAEPAILVRVQSVNELLATAEHFLKFIPNNDQIKNGLGFVKDAIDEKKGLEGFDVKKPFGLYATISEDSPIPAFAIILPVADEQAVLNLLTKRLSLDPKKGDDGVYEVEIKDQPFTVYFRFAHKYAYVTALNKDNIDAKTLPKPEDVLGQKVESTLSAVLRLDRVPKDMKKFVIGTVEEQLNALKDMKLPGETDAMGKFKTAAIDKLTGALKSVLEDGRSVALKVNLDKKADDLSFELEFKPVAGSKLAKDVAGMKDGKSVIAGALAGKDVAAKLTFGLALPADLKKAFDPAADDLLAMLLDKTPDAGAKEVLTPVVKSLAPTLKAGEIDVGVGAFGPNKDGLYTVLLGLKLAEGLKVEEQVKTLVKLLTDNNVPNVERVKLDADKAGGVALHKFEVGDMVPQNLVTFLGKSDAWLAFRDDLLVVAVGPDAKEAVKKAAAAKPSTSPKLMELEVSVAKLAGLLGDTPEEKKASAAAALKVFGKEPKGDVVNVTLAGGDTLSLKISAKAKLVEFLGEMGKGQKKDN